MDLVLSLVIMPLVIGIIASVIATMICIKVIVFRENRSQCLEVLYLNSGPFNNLDEVIIAKKNAEKLDYLANRFYELGHIKVYDEIMYVYNELSRKLNDIESSFNHSEVRGDISCDNISIKGENINKLFKKLSDINPNWKIYFKLNFKV